MEKALKDFQIGYNFAWAPQRASCFFRVRIFSEFLSNIQIDPHPFFAGETRVRILIPFEIHINEDAEQVEQRLKEAWAWSDIELTAYRF